MNNWNTPSHIFGKHWKCARKWSSFLYKYGKMFAHPNSLFATAELRKQHEGERFNIFPCSGFLIRIILKVFDKSETQNTAFYKITS